MPPTEKPASSTKMLGAAPNCNLLSKDEPDAFADIDCKRPLVSPESILARSNAIAIPGNHSLMPEGDISASGDCSGLIIA